jgi:hypothetical protein
MAEMVTLTLPSTLRAEWIEGGIQADFTRADAKIYLFFGECSIAAIDIPKGFDRKVPMAQYAIDSIVADFLRDKLFDMGRRS